MDDHFHRMLAPVMSRSRFPKYISSATFIGSKPGYYFSTGERGTGYYEDIQETPDEVDASRIDVDFREEIRETAKLDGVGIEKMLDDAENAGIAPLDPNSLKQLLITFEKRIAKNQNMRMKYPDQPEKFMDSEIELHSVINDLCVVAASPELYHVMVASGAIVNILGMITHENTDVSLAAIGLMQEMVDAEILAEMEDSTFFIDCFVQSQGLELIVQNLSRLDEANDEDAQGVHHTMAVIENLVDVDPSIAVQICAKTHILKFLLLRLKVRKFDANKLYCSEILSILLQADEKNQQRVCNLHDADGLDLLLQTIAPYRKRDPASADEQECINNLFLSLCSLLLEPGHQDLFRQVEGLELMLKCIKEQKYATIGAVKALNFATSGNRVNCIRLVEIGGLKFLFPMLLGRGLPKIAHTNRSSGRSKRQETMEAEEAALSMISQMCSQLHDCDDSDCSSRLLGKFLENEREKLERCVEMFVEWNDRLKLTEQKIEQTIRSMERSGDEEMLEEYASAENIYLQRMEGGLFQLQQLAVIIAFVCARDLASRQKAQLRLRSRGQEMGDVLRVLSGAADALNEEDIDEEDDNVEEGSSVVPTNDIKSGVVMTKKRQRKDVDEEDDGDIGSSGHFKKRSEHSNERSEFNDREEGEEKDIEFPSARAKQTKDRLERQRQKELFKAWTTILLEHFETD